MTAAWLLLLAVLALILANALFVAVEFSYLTVNKAQVRKEAQAGDRTMQAVSNALARTSSNLSGAQLGITVTSLVVGFLTGPSLGVLLTEGLGVTGIAPAAATGIATTAAFVIATFTQMVFGELVPKNWAIAEPLLVSRLVVFPQRIFMLVFGWLVWVLNSAANVVLRLLGFTPEEEVASARNAQELRAVVSQSGRQGTLDRTSSTSSPTPGTPASPSSARASTRSSASSTSSTPSRCRSRSGPPPRSATSPSRRPTSSNR